MRDKTGFESTAAAMNDLKAITVGAGIYEMTLRRLRPLRFYETPDQREIDIRMSVIQHQLKHLSEGLRNIQ